MTQPALQRSIQHITQTLVILLTLYYTLLGGFAVGVHESRWRLVTYILTGLLWAGWLVNRLKRKQPWPRTPLDWPLLVVIGTVILSTIFSTDPRLSFDSLLLTLAYGLCFYFAVDLVKNRVLTETIINAMLLTALVVCVVGLFEYWQWYYGDWLGEVNRRTANIPWSLSTSRRIKSVLNNPNILAYYLLPILGLSLYKLSHTNNSLIRLGWSATDAGSGVASYKLQVSTDGGSYKTVKLSKATSTSVDRTLTNGHRYRFRVLATGSAVSATTVTTTVASSVRLPSVIVYLKVSVPLKRPDGL
jgi:hypothetical protein